MYNYLKYFGYTLASTYYGLYKVLLCDSIYKLCLDTNITNLQIVFMSALVFWFGIRDTFTYIAFIAIYNRLQNLNDIMNNFNEKYELNKYANKLHQYIQEQYDEYIELYVSFINEKIDSKINSVYTMMTTNEKYQAYINKLIELKTTIVPYMESVNIYAEENNTITDSTNSESVLETTQDQLNMESFLRSMQSQPNMNLEAMMSNLKQSELNSNGEINNMLQQLDEFAKLATLIEPINTNNTTPPGSPLNRKQKRLLKKMQKINE